MDHDTLEVVRSRFGTGAEVGVEVEDLIELKLSVNFHFEEGLEIKDYSLKVDDEDFWRLLDQGLFSDFVYSFVAVYTEII